LGEGPSLLFELACDRVLLLELLLDVRRRRAGGGVGMRTVERQAVGADDRDVILGEPRDRRRYQVHDARDLGLAEAAPGAKAEHDRGRRELLVDGEDAVLGQNQVHAGSLDGTHGGNRSRKLTLERAAKRDALLELRRPEVRLVEDLETDAAAPRKSLAGEI